jgi:hypothetical protein
MKFLLLSLFAGSALLTMAMDDTKDLFDLDAILQDKNVGDLEWLNFTFEPEPPAEKEKRPRSPQQEFGTADQSEVVQQKMPRLDDISQSASSIPKSQMIPGITCLACVDKLPKSSAEKAALEAQIIEYWNKNKQRVSYVAHVYDLVPNSPVRRIAPICRLK